jgi:tetratricopeptide (TPR) repeat protein
MSALTALATRLHDEQKEAALSLATHGLRLDLLPRTRGMVNALCAAAIDAVFRDVATSRRYADAAVNVALDIDPASYPRPLVAQIRLTAYKDLATVLRQAAEYEGSHDALDQAALAAADEPSLEYDRAILRLSRALTFSQEQQYEEALELLRQASETFSEYQDQFRLGQCLHARGATEYRLARYEDAISSFAGALAIAQQGNDLRTTTSLLSNLGFAHLEAGHMNEAATALHRALGLARELDLRPEYASVRWGLARIQNANGLHSSAASEFIAVQSLFTAVGMPEEVGLSALDAAEALLAMNDQSAARSQLKHALEAFASAQLPSRAMTALAYLRELTDAEQLTPPPIRQVRRYLATRPLYAFAPTD